MSAKELPPWATGPGEILRHGLSLLDEDSDANRRLAMIAIDNSVELIIKTFLGLPKRIAGISISRKEYQEISESFPALLDALEKHATDKIVGIDLGEVSMSIITETRLIILLHKYYTIPNFDSRASKRLPVAAFSSSNFL